MPDPDPEFHFDEVWTYHSFEECDINKIFKMRWRFYDVTVILISIDEKCTTFYIFETGYIHKIGRNEFRNVSVVDIDIPYDKDFQMGWGDNPNHHAPFTSDRRCRKWLKQHKKVDRGDVVDY